MPLDRPALAQALGKTPGASADGVEQPYTLLCRREAGAFQRAAKGGAELLVCCTQESRLFLELNEETAGAPRLEERPEAPAEFQAPAGLEHHLEFAVRQPLESLDALQVDDGRAVNAHEALGIELRLELGQRGAVQPFALARM